VTRARPWILLPAGAAASTALGMTLGIPWLFPLLGAAVPIPLFVQCIRRGHPGAAMGWALYWSLAQSLAIGLAVTLAPERAAVTIWHGAAYAREMLQYIRTGQGAEGSPHLFLPVHLRHYLGFCLLSVVSVGAGGLLLGTVLLNYMNMYVAELVRASVEPGLALCFGWPIWAVLRVVGYVATGAGLADLGWRMASRGTMQSRPPYSPRFLLLGFGCVLLDALLKALLAPSWRSVLVRALAGPA
jgi:hypothetical protein